jgi:hypothetical protein
MMTPTMTPICSTAIPNDGWLVRRFPRPPTDFSSWRMDSFLALVAPTRRHRRSECLPCSIQLLRPRSLGCSRRFWGRYRHPSEEGLWHTCWVHPPQSGYIHLNLCVRSSSKQVNSVSVNLVTQESFALCCDESAALEQRDDFSFDRVCVVFQQRYDASTEG